jgi:hypothetical protein
MKVLSLLQPWATLVVTGAKKIETRSWRTSYRGPLLIHASAGKAGALLAAQQPFTKYIQRFHELPFGAIVGSVTLQDVVPIDALLLSDEAINRLTLEERAFGDYREGRYGWLLSDAAAFEKPVPMRGHLHLWEYNGALM